MNIFKRLKCWWNGHDWDKSTGFKGYALPGAVCNHCGTKANVIEAGP